VYLSPRHAKVEMTGETLKLIDENSQNGTFVRIRGERELGHGDYLFLGRNLLRVEVTA
jgi:pSer/pThr/pTyr-binding forkhead associated (FHA) protein